HPTPALGGYPQVEAVNEIKRIENLDRGWYAGPVGWVDFQGNGEFAVAIRSGLLNGDQATLYAGCGIVGDSDPDSEYEETKMKFKPMLTA
ncbi:chorismate-binding protein, partial [Micrococcus sp. SIMBA_144]